MFLKLNKLAYINSIELENVKCFKKRQKLYFSDSKNRPYQWTVLLGDNGTGKTTILRSIINAVFEFYYLEIKRNFGLLGIIEGSEISIEFINIDGTITTTINSINITKGIHENYDKMATARLNIFSYGAHRIGEKEGVGSFGVDSTLMNEDSKLIDVEFWIKELYIIKSVKDTDKSINKFELVKDILINILPDVEDIRIKADTRNSWVEFKNLDGWIKYQDMSLGYRAVTSWILDLTIRMTFAYPDHKKPLEQPAVVLVDEIDLHMHPKWQQTIMAYLSERFPKVQFIVTAHSPLIVQSAIDANVIVLKRKDGQIMVENKPIDVTTWRIDQILSSELFDSINPRNAVIQKDINRRKVLTLKEKLSTSEKKELAMLNEGIESLPSAESPEMIRAMEFILQAAKQLKK